MKLALSLVMMLASCAWGQVEVKRGITGELTFEYEGRELTTVQQDLSSPLLLRLERTGESAYMAWFIGSVEGEYDLGSLIRTRSGAEPTGLQPLPVSIVSNLPESFATDLYDAADLRVGIAGGYRRLLITFGVAWLAVPIVVIVRRLMRPRVVEEVVVEAPKPSLADQLRPLVQAAASRELTIAEQGRLELLLVHYWRERIASDAPDVAAAISVIRAHDEAGELLEAVERWLHDPGVDAHDPQRLEALLEPYRRAAPIEEGALMGEAAPA